MFAKRFLRTGTALNFESKIADELIRCARFGKRTLIDLQNAGLKILNATAKTIRFNWFGLRRFYSW
jgi:hypothetical protein